MTFVGRKMPLTRNTADVNLPRLAVSDYRTEFHNQM